MEAGSPSSHRTGETVSSARPAKGECSPKSRDERFPSGDTGQKGQAVLRPRNASWQGAPMRASGNRRATMSFMYRMRWARSMTKTAVIGMAFRRLRVDSRVSRERLAARRWKVSFIGTVLLTGFSVTPAGAFP